MVINSPFTEAIGSYSEYYPGNMILLIVGVNVIVSNLSAISVQDPLGKMFTSNKCFLCMKINKESFFANLRQ